MFNTRHTQPAPLFDRSPPNMAPIEVRQIIQDAMHRIGVWNMQPGRKLLSVGALQDALEAMASGYTESACQAAQEADTLRRMGE
jgi:hypothetical protein